MIEDVRRREQDHRGAAGGERERREVPAHDGDEDADDGEAEDEAPLRAEQVELCDDGKGVVELHPRLAELLCVGALGEKRDQPCATQAHGEADGERGAHEQAGHPGATELEEVVDDEDRSGNADDQQAHRMADDGGSYGYGGGGEGGGAASAEVAARDGERDEAERGAEREGPDAHLEDPEPAQVVPASLGHDEEHAADETGRAAEERAAEHVGRHRHEQHEAEDGETVRRPVVEQAEGEIAEERDPEAAAGTVEVVGRVACEPEVAKAADVACGKEDVAREPRVEEVRRVIVAHREATGEQAPVVDEDEDRDAERAGEFAPGQAKEAIPYGAEEAHERASP